MKCKAIVAGCITAALTAQAHARWEKTDNYLVRGNTILAPLVYDSANPPYSPLYKINNHVLETKNTGYLTPIQGTVIFYSDPNCQNDPRIGTPQPTSFAISRIFMDYNGEIVAVEQQKDYSTETFHAYSISDGTGCNSGEILLDSPNSSAKLIPFSEFEDKLHLVEDSTGQLTVHFLAYTSGKYETAKAYFKENQNFISIKINQSSEIWEVLSSEQGIPKEQIRIEYTETGSYDLVLTDIIPNHVKYQDSVIQCSDNTSISSIAGKHRISCYQVDNSIESTKRIRVVTKDDTGNPINIDSSITIHW